MSVPEQRDLHQRRPRRVRLLVPLPGGKDGDEQQRDDDQQVDPDRLPPDNVALGQREQEAQDARRDQEPAEPVDRAGQRLFGLVGRGRLLGRGRWYQEDTGCGHCDGQDGIGAKDPFPVCIGCD